MTITFNQISSASELDAAAAEVGVAAAPVEEPPLLSAPPSGYPNVPVDFIDLKITPYGAVFNADGAEKVVSYDSLIAMLSSAANTTAGGLEDLFLPSNVFYFGRSGSNLYLNMYFPEAVKTIQFYDRKRPSVVPNIILSVPLTKDSGSGDYRVGVVKYFCTDLPVSKLPRQFISSINHANRVFLLPFTNTYDDGHMCTGGNTMPVRLVNGNLRGLDWYYNYLFESPFNEDLGVRATGMSPSNWYDLLAKTAEAGARFPYEKLRGWTNQTTSTLPTTP